MRCASSSETTDQAALLASQLMRAGLGTVALLVAAVSTLLGSSAIAQTSDAPKTPEAPRASDALAPPPPATPPASAATSPLPATDGEGAQPAPPADLAPASPAQENAPAYPPTGYPPPGYPPPGYPPPGYPPPGYPPPGYPPTGYPPIGYPPSAYPGYYPDAPGYPVSPDTAMVAEAAPAPDPGFHRHDRFFLQMQMGIAGFAYKPTPARTPKGVGLGWDISLGAVVAERLLLGGGFSMTVGETLDSGPAYTSVLFGFYADLIYYLPSNFFFGGSVGIAGMAASKPNTSSSASDVKIGSTDPGLFVKAQVGHEWWVSSNWALGVALRATFARAKEADAGPYAPVWTGGTAGLLFSATYD